MLYKVIRQLFVWIFQLFYRWDVKGQEHFPDEGAFLLCANHISWWDPPLMGGITRRTVRFMSKEELFNVPIIGKILPLIYVFPVKRDSADRRAIKTALDTLKGGGAVGIFPEGTRSRTNDLLPPQAGIGLIATKSEAPVIPVAIIGPYRLFRPIKVRIGKPITFPEYYGTRVKSADLEDVAQRIMAEIALLRQS